MMIDDVKASDIPACDAIVASHAGLQKGATVLGKDAESSDVEETTAVRSLVTVMSCCAQTRVSRDLLLHATNRTAGGDDGSRLMMMVIDCKIRLGKCAR